MQCIGHDAVTSGFIGRVTRQSPDGPEPPPPLVRVFRASLRMNKPLTSTFGRRLLRLWGEFVGSYSTPAYGKKAARQCTRADTLGVRGSRWAAALGSMARAVCSAMHLP